ncbi:MAG TPA: class I SAM-dependent methyltransferase [Beijerinckiaceae bacterium]|nr:class I SAM-dependent methyltransferase [Beijerinckiaceae bacterium]
MAVHERYRDFMADQRQFFDELITEDWASYASPVWDEIRRYELDKIFARVQPARILDMGCGCGFHDAEMALRPFVEQVDAFDYSSKSVEKANEAYPHSKVKRFVADLATFAPENRYDLVASFQVYEHLEDVGAYFDACRRACAPGGMIVIVTPNRTRLNNRIRNWRGLPDELCDPQHFREYTIADIHADAARHGFEPAGGFGYGLYGWPWLERIPHRVRLRLGAIVPSIAHGIAAFARAPR